MITFVPEDEDQNIPGLSMGYILLTKDSHIKNIESILKTPFKNIDAFKAMNDTDKNLANLLRTCTDLTVLDEIDWHPETLFRSLSKNIPTADIHLINYSVTEDRIHYKLDYGIRGIRHVLTIETDAVKELLDAINAELVDRQFVEIAGSTIDVRKWALISKDVNIENLAEAAYCVIKNW